MPVIASSFVSLIWHGGAVSKAHEEAPASALAQVKKWSRGDPLASWLLPAHRCGRPRRLWLALLYHLEIFERSSSHGDVTSAPGSTVASLQVALMVLDFGRVIT